jgi:divalent metal cation (Fe/Co/Zn/Cd) transporter
VTDTARSSALTLGVRVETVTVTWMAVEAVLAISAGVAARSVLLTAFGADSVIELLSGATLWWRLRVESFGGDEAKIAGVEKTATRISAALLVLLCAYVVLASIAGLAFAVKPEVSWLGVAVAAAAVVLMPVLGARKRAVNLTLQSPALRADIAESVTCAYLAAVTLVGIAVGAVTGLWWIEYVAALVLLRWLIPEAREAMEAAGK